MRAKLTTRTIAQLAPREKPYDVRDATLAGFLLRVQPSGHRSWFFQYRGPEGRQTRLKLGDSPGLSPEGARAVALERATEVSKGVDLVARKRAARDAGQRARHRALRAFLDDRYEPWATTHLKSAAFQLARIRSDFADWLDRPMTDLNAFAVEGMRQRWKREGMKPRSINRDVQRLQSVLSRAVEWRVLDSHPLAGLKPMKADKTGRVRFLSPGEEESLRRALGEREDRLRQARIRFNTWRVARGKQPLPEREGELLDHLRPLVLLAINTGLRRGELLGLMWGDVNLPAKLLTVRAESAKSGHTRRVPLNPEAHRILSAWHARRGAPAEDSLVFPGTEGRRIARIDTAWRGLMKAAGITGFRLHDCRHHFASKLVQRGVGLYAVKELLGHSEIAMTERYSHLAPDNLRAAVDAL